MARTTRTSLATSAKAAAKKVIGRRGSAAQAEPTPAPVKKSAPAKKAAPAKKTPVKKAAPAKKAAPVKKAAPAKKAAPPQQAALLAQAAPMKKAASVKKAAPARKATPAKLVVLEGEAAWTRGELNEVIKELREHHDRLSVALDVSEKELARLMRDAGDGAGQDQADLGATSFERDHELTVLANEREMLEQIDRALSHIDEGTYGVCDSCGNAIGKNRLMAFPRATLCMSCKQREERR